MICDQIWEKASDSLLAHLTEISEKGHEEMGINLVPQSAPEHDERYHELRGKDVGTVWAPSESPVINILAWSNKSLQTLLSKKFVEEGFQVVTGEKPNYFADSPLRFLVVSWKHVYSSSFDRLVETVERIQAHVESIAEIRAVEK